MKGERISIFNNQFLVEKYISHQKWARFARSYSFTKENAEHILRNYGDIPCEEDAWQKLCELAPDFYEEEES